MCPTLPSPASASPALDLPRRVLAIETSTALQSIALMDGARLLEHRQMLAGMQHGQTLLENIDAMLAAHRMGVSELDAIVTGLGPGGFTSLRVGLATAKGLARAAKVPIVGVSSLAALALPAVQANPQALVWAVNDARRQEVYAAAYRHDATQAGAMACEEPAHTASPQALLGRIAELAASGRTIIVVGDGPAQYLELARLADAGVHLPTALSRGPSAVALVILGRALLAARGPDDLASLEPDYIRPSDAEIPKELRGASFQKS